MSAPFDDPEAVRAERAAILAPALPDEDVPRVIGQIVDERNDLHIAICNATAKPYTEHFDQAAALMELRTERDALRERLAKLEALAVRSHKHLFDEGTAEDCECRGCTLCRDLAKELPT